ncbi:hypothetical protein [Streptomyces sp. ATCC 21386]|uniref:hypothetical protein n=1 Tax=Streptomyces sp. ATCC 21386 TaxID=2699428 RepID=UPI001BFF635C|nr:hypothetical protein [Streptomyces sp. ATCC 21386]
MADHVAGSNTPASSPTPVTELLALCAAPRAAAPARRLIAAGLIRHLPGRTLTVRATPVGVTGTITPTPLAQTLDDDSDDACPVCGYWTCRCGTARTHAVAVAAR